MSGLLWYVLATAAAARPAAPADDLRLLAARMDVAARHYIDAGSSDGISVAIVRCGRSAVVAQGLAAGRWADERSR